MKNILSKSIILCLFLGCSNKTTKMESLNLDANTTNDKMIKSIINSKEDSQTIVYLDKKEYKINEFKKITDTINGKYYITIEKLVGKQVVNIIRK